MYKKRAIVDAGFVDVIASLMRILRVKLSE